MDLWQQQLIALILGPTSVVAAVSFLIKKIFDNQSARDIEQFKYQLELQKSEFNTKYSYIHSKRSEIIGELYGILVDTTSSLSDLTALIRISDGTSLEQRKSTFASEFNKLSTFYIRSRIYLENSTCDQLDLLLKTMRDIYVDYDVATFGNQYDFSKTSAEMWKKAWEQMEQKVPPLKEELENGFKKSIGLI